MSGEKEVDPEFREGAMRIMLVGQADHETLAWAHQPSEKRAA